MNTKKKKKKKKEAVGRLLYSRINTVTPARRVGAAEGSSSLFLPFPPCVTKATETTSSGVNIQRSKKKKKRKKMFFLFFFLVFFDVFMYRLRYEDDVCRDLRCQHSHDVDVGGGSKSKIKNVLKKRRRRMYHHHELDNVQTRASFGRVK